MTRVYTGVPLTIQGITCLDGMRQKRKKHGPRNRVIISQNKEILKKRFPHIWEKIQVNGVLIKSYQNRKQNTEKCIQFQEKSDDRNDLLDLEKGDRYSITRIIDYPGYEPYDMLFLIGMGLGHLLLETIKKDPIYPRILIIEPSMQIFMQAFHKIDLQPLFSNKCVDIFIGETINLAAIVDRHQDLVPIGRNKIIVHPNYEKIFGQKITVIKQELAERIRAVRDNWYTTKQHGQRMFTNAVANLPSLFAGTPMKNLRGQFKGIPAVCVAAGPSLDNAIPELKKLEKHTLLIACDSAVNALLEAGIRPHIVVTTDIFETNIDKLKPHFEALRETVFIYSIESNPDNVRQYLGKRRVAVSAYSKLLLFWLDPTLKLESKLPAMTSVSHMAIFSAMALGAAPIIMVGMDLAYSHGRSHSFDSVFFDSLDHKKLVSTYGNNGSMIPSAPQFVADKLLIEKIVGQTPVRFINTSLSGAYIAGTEVKRLAEVLEVECTAQLDVNALMGSIDWTSAADEIAASTIIKNLSGQFLAFRELCTNKKQELLDEINKIGKRPQAKLALKKMKGFENAFDEFQENHRIYKHMIKEIMLADLEEIFKQKEILSVCSDKKVTDILLESLKLLVKHYETYEKGMDFQINQIQKFGNFANGLDELNHGLDGSEKACDKHIQLARYFENFGELWQAKREYDYCMDRKPNDITPYLELAQAYAKVNLWEPAQAVLIIAHSVFNDAGELVQLENDIESGINGIFEEIKKEWMQGNMHTTRKLLNQYLILRPDDPQANELKMVIRKLDEEFSGEWTEGEKEKTVNPDMQIRFKQAVTHVKNRQFEQGVGILEGLADDFPESGGGLREQIGDIRMMQKDTNSALWNYTQLLMIEPQRLDLNNKINKIKMLQSRRAVKP